MKAIINKLLTSKFSRIHRSYIINKDKIELIEDNAIIIKTKSGTKAIPIGKSYREKLMSELNLITR